MFGLNVLAHFLERVNCNTPSLCRFCNEIETQQNIKQNRHIYYYRVLDAMSLRAKRFNSYLFIFLLVLIVEIGFKR